MKSQRRHELKQNVLDTELGQVINFLKRRATILTWGLLVVALIALLVVYVRNKQRTEHQELVSKYEQLKIGLNVKPDQRLEGLKDLAKQGDNPRIAALANLAQADEYAHRYILGGSKLSDRQQREYGNKADLLYRRVINLKNMPWAAARGHMGFAKLCESRREFIAARSSYQAILRMGDEAGQMREVAEESLANLDRLKAPVPMATTRPAEPETQPASAPADEGGGTAAPKPAAEPDGTSEGASAGERTEKPKPPAQMNQPADFAAPPPAE